MALFQLTHDPLPALLNTPGVQGMPGILYNLTAGDTRLVITDLTPNTNYNITLCAFTSVGCGQLSSRVNQTDEDGKTVLKFALTICCDSSFPEQLPRQSLIWQSPRQATLTMTIL